MRVRVLHPSVEEQDEFLAVGVRERSAEVEHDLLRRGESDKALIWLDARLVFTIRVTDQRCVRFSFEGGELLGVDGLVGTEGHEAPVGRLTVGGETLVRQDDEPVRVIHDDQLRLVEVADLLHRFMDAECPLAVLCFE